MRTVTCIAAACLAVAASLIASVDAGAQTRIRVAWAAAPPELVPLIFSKPGIAKHLGKSYTFEPIRFATSPLMVTALAAGEIDMAPLAPLSFASAVLNARMDDLKVIADEFQDGADGYGSAAYFVLKDSGIKSVKDLKSKRIAVMGVGSAGDIGLRIMLEKDGLKYREDYTTVEARPRNLVPMLVDKKVDMIGGPIFLAFHPDIRAKATPLFTMKDAMGPTQLLFFVARDKFIQENRAALVDFFEDWIAAIRWFTAPENRDEAVKIVADFAKQKPESFNSWLFTKSDVFRSRDAKPNLKSLQTTLDTLNGIGLLTSKLDVSKHADLSIVEEARRRLKN